MKQVDRITWSSLLYRIRCVIYLFLTWISISSVQAQDVPASIQAGLGVIGGFPVGQFGDNVTNPGLGISGHVGYRFPRSPVIFGIDMAYLIYGRESRRERFSTTIPDVHVNVVTDNNILMTNFFLRLQPREGPFRPYIDGLLGFHYLFTKTAIKDIPDPFGDDIASSVNFSDVAFTYGGSVGFMVEVYDGRSSRTQSTRSTRTVSIDFRVRYREGAEALYLKRGDVLRAGGQAALNLTRSETNIVVVFIGAAIEF